MGERDYLRSGLDWGTILRWLILPEPVWLDDPKFARWRAVREELHQALEGSIQVGYHLAAAESQHDEPAGGPEGSGSDWRSPRPK